MDGADYEKVKQHLLSVANILAPTGIEQRGFVELTVLLEEHPVRQQRIVQLLYKLLDGLQYGNWPQAKE